MDIMSGMLRQCRKPRGWFGRFMAWGMNSGHAKLTDWGLTHVFIDRRFTILDIGCGGGATIFKLAGMASEGKVYGLDYSEESVRVARIRNRASIKAGQVDIRHGSVSAMPFTDDMFDLVSAVETHYFWPDLNADLKEVLRVLKPGGTLILIGEAYKGGKFEERNEKWVVLGNMAYHTIPELRELLSSAGYAGVEVNEDFDQGWMCAKGIKPA